MNSNVLAVIRNLYPVLTPSGKQVADYVLGHGDEVIFMPITELAYRCSVSETSIMRFCHHAGMSGYQDFRLQLSSAISQEKALLPALSDAGDATTQLIENIYTSFHTSIQGTKQLLRPEKLSETAKYICEAEEIFFFGSRDSMSLASNACNSFIHSFGKGRCVQDGYAQELLLNRLSKKDLAIFISAKFDNDELFRLAERAKHRGAKLVSISCCGPTSISGLCNVNLYCGRTDPDALCCTATRENCLNLASVSFIVELICTSCLENGKNPPPKTAETQPHPRPLPQTYYPDH